METPDVVDAVLPGGARRRIRRRDVVLVAALLLLGVLLLVAGSLVALTQSDRGQQFLARVAVQQLQRGMQGKLQLGRVSGTLFTDLVIDTVTVRDWQDSVVLTSGRIAVRWDPRDLLDRRIQIRALTAAHPILWIRQYENGDWNYRHVFGQWGAPKAPRLPGQRKLGDIIVVDTAEVRDGGFALTLPWHPSDSLRGQKLDSALAYNLGRRDAEIRRAEPVPNDTLYTRTWRWTRITYALGRSRLAHPDTAGQFFTLGTADAVETDPAFAWRNVRGTVRRVHDSVWVDLPHWDLSGSTGTGRGKIWWGGGLPTRYDLTVRGDSVSMRDVAWIYPTLPRTGGGTVTLRIVSQADNPRVIEYRLQNMDARSLDSRLLGNMTFAVGGPVLGVTDVDLTLAPADMRLAREFNGEPFPYDWQGTIRGRVEARGGPANRFFVDNADLVFDDRHVPGARSTLRGRGMLDILFPAVAAFRGFEVTEGEVDLRTPRFVNPNFPELNGIARGRAILDSVWLDVRFREADVEHIDGPGPPSRVTGNGRFTLEDEFVRFDLTLDVPQLSYTTLQRSYPALPLRGLASGPVRATGTANDATVSLLFTGVGGTLRYDGQVDAFEPSFGANGSFAGDSLSLPLLLGNTSWPTSRLAVRGDVAMTGAVPSDLAGRFALDVLDGSRVRDLRIFGGTVRGGMRNGVVQLDSARVATSTGTIIASGGLGVTASAHDSMRVSITVDSLGGLRQIVGDRELGGRATMRMMLAGTIDTLADPASSAGLSVTGVLRGTDVQLDAVRTQQAVVDFSVRNALRGAQGVVTMQVDSSDVQSITDPLDRERGAARRTSRLTYARAVVALDSGTVRRATVRARGDNGASMIMAGGRSMAPLAPSMLAAGIRARYQIDSLEIAPDTIASPYRLRSPAVLLDALTGWALDTLLVQRADGAGLSLTGLRVGAAPSDAAADTRYEGLLAVTRLPLADLGHLAQLTTPVRGALSGQLALGDGADGRTLRGGVRVDSALIGPVRIDSLFSDVTYAKRRMRVGARLVTGGVALANGFVERSMDLLGNAGARDSFPDRPLDGRLVSPAADLSVIAGLFPDLESPTGALGLDVRLSGTNDRPRLDGAFTIRDGRMGLSPLGVQLTNVDAEVRLSGDTLDVRRLFARGLPRGTTDRRLGTVLGLTDRARDVLRDSLSVTGRITFAELTEPAFDLTLAANEFTAIDKVRTASLELSTPRPVTLKGRLDASRVTGTVRVDRGRVTVPALSQKRVVDLEENLALVDTTLADVRMRLPRAPDRLVRGLTLDGVSLEVGDDVWLRSPEANIKLGGALRVTRGFDARTGDPQLALSDSLTVERGTYQLNLGLARPMFDVERGAIRFFGDPELNPSLAINALHVVRAQRANSNRQDVRIRVTMGGTVQQPILALSSADSPPLPESDMLSYLITGEPAFARLGTQYAEQGATLALRLAGSYLSSRLAGGPFDVVQVQPSLFGQTEALAVGNTTSGLSGVLAGTRIGLGGQIGNKTFLTLSTGLCGLDPAAAGGSDQLSLFAQGIGVKVERRLNRSTTLQFGLEPGSSALACGRLGGSRTFQQTPPQIGIDFFKAWQF
jgi:translocation and assembly module TamB